MRSRRTTRTTKNPLPGKQQSKPCARSLLSHHDQRSLREFQTRWSLSRLSHEEWLLPMQLCTPKAQTSTSNILHQSTKTLHLPPVAWQRARRRISLPAPRLNRWSQEVRPESPNLSRRLVASRRTTRSRLLPRAVRLA